jgi:hypothetical protein
MTAIKVIIILLCKERLNIQRCVVCNDLMCMRNFVIIHRIFLERGKYTKALDDSRNLMK